MPAEAKIIVLDRDGVINFDSPDYIKSPGEWRPLPGSLEAIRLLHEAGYVVTVATNQSGLARGLFDDYALARIHQLLSQSAEESGGFVNGIFYCPHHPDDACQCRKPATGLLQQIESEFHLPLAGQILVGDSIRDLQAAISHGMQPLLVRTGNGQLTERRLQEYQLADIPVYDDLLQAVTQRILAPHA